MSYRINRLDIAITDCVQAHQTFSYLQFNKGYFNTILNKNLMTDIGGDITYYISLCINTDSIQFK